MMMGIAVFHKQLLIFDFMARLDYNNWIKEDDVPFSG